MFNINRERSKNEYIFIRIRKYNASVNQIGVDDS